MVHVVADGRHGGFACSAFLSDRSMGVDEVSTTTLLVKRNQDAPMTGDGLRMVEIVVGCHTVD
jgi:hypothetical protein